MFDSPLAGDHQFLFVALDVTCGFEHPRKTK